MRFVRDAVVDEIVRKDERLQDHIHARIVILWLPGMSSVIAVQCLLMVAGIGIALALLWFWPLTAEHFKYYVGGIVLGSIPMAALYNLLIRGFASARTNMFRLSVAYASIAAVQMIVFLVTTHKVSLCSAAISFAAGLAAVQQIAGPSYALLAAIYRAQRVQLLASKSDGQQAHSR